MATTNANPTVDLATGDLRTNGHTSPLAIPANEHAFSWQLHTDQSNQHQRACRLQLATSAEALHRNEPDVHDTGRIDSDRLYRVPYTGPALAPRTAYHWRVHVWNADDQPGPWSPTARFETAPDQLASHARWIGMAPADRGDAAPHLRRVFHLDKPVQSARVHVLGLGYHELHLNGQRVGDHLLDPAQTDYDQRLFYVTHDLTHALQPGDNALGIILGDGWFHQNKVWLPEDMTYGQPCLRLELDIRHPDGSTTSITTDDRWRTATGPILANNVYAGETYDARLEIPGWANPGFNDTNWAPPVLMPPPPGTPQPQPLEPIRHTHTLPPASLDQPQPGVHVYDMGQNFAGHVRLRIQARPGTRLRLRMAERIDDHGRLDLQSTGIVHTHAPQTLTYIAKGHSTETWEPRFAYFGFQYVELVIEAGQLTREPDLQTLQGIVAHTDLRPVGSFECSHDLINRLHVAAGWTLRSNVHGLPTDCPHREKCGWLGDAHVIVPFSMYRYDADNLWRKYLGDILTGAAPEHVDIFFGRGFEDRSTCTKPPGIPHMIAPGKRTSGIASPDWGAALAIIPWELYQFTGDPTPLRTMYPAMLRWIDYLNNQADGRIMPHGLGDWTAPDHPDFQTPLAVTSTFFYWRSARILADAAALLDRRDDAHRYNQLAHEIRLAFIATFYDPRRHTFHGQTADALALKYHLFPEPDRQHLADSLARDVAREHDHHFRTGIFGHQALFEMLTDHGHDDVAYRLITQTTAPSFGHLLSLGATTIWEHPANPGQPIDHERSKNHPMNAPWDAWFFNGIAGIRPDPTAPGFRRLLFRPALTDHLEWACARYRSVQGLVESHWQTTDGRFTWHLTVPPNATARVHIPAADPAAVYEGDAPAADRLAPLRADRSLPERPFVVCEVGSGRYRFSAPAR